MKIQLRVGTRIPLESTYLCTVCVEHRVSLLETRDGVLLSVEETCGCIVWILSEFFKAVGDGGSRAVDELIVAHTHAPRLNVFPNGGQQHGYLFE